MQCINLPVLGPTCLQSLKVNLGSVQVDLSHPGVSVTILLLAVIGIFVFRSPVR